jgi:hypothetical protein
VDLLSLATLGNVAQTGLHLFASLCPRWSGQVKPPSLLHAFFAKKSALQIFQLKLPKLRLMTIGRFVFKTGLSSNCGFLFFGYLGQYSTIRIASICATLPKMVKASKTIVAAAGIFAKTNLLSHRCFNLGQLN